MMDNPTERTDIRKDTRKHSQRTKITDKKCKQSDALMGSIQIWYPKYSSTMKENVSLTISFSYKTELFQSCN